MSRNANRMRDSEPGRTVTWDSFNRSPVSARAFKPVSTTQVRIMVPYGGSIREIEIYGKAETELEEEGALDDL